MTIAYVWLFFAEKKPLFKKCALHLKILLLNLVTKENFCRQLNLNGKMKESFLEILHFLNEISFSHETGAAT